MKKAKTQMVHGMKISSPKEEPKPKKQRVWPKRTLKLFFQLGTGCAAFLWHGYVASEAYWLVFEDKRLIHSNWWIQHYDAYLLLDGALLLFFALFLIWLLTDILASFHGRRTIPTGILTVFMIVGFGSMWLPSLGEKIWARTQQEYHWQVAQKNQIPTIHGTSIESTWQGLLTAKQVGICRRLETLPVDEIIKGINKIPANNREVATAYVVCRREMRRKLTALLKKWQTYRSPNA